MQLPAFRKGQEPPFVRRRIAAGTRRFVRSLRRPRTRRSNVKRAKERQPPSGKGVGNVAEVTGGMATDATRATKPRWWRWPEWVGYAAGAWAFAFAAMSFYWAVGGTVGIAMQAPSIKELAVERPAWFVATLWATGALKALAGLLALALVRGWGSLVPRWILLVAAWGVGALLSLYGGANLGVRGLMAVGVMSTPESMHSAAARWHLLLWDPWWLLGGVLFGVAAWGYQRGSRTKVRRGFGSVTTCLRRSPPP